jgi:hypothetical protein
MTKAQKIVILAAAVLILCAILFPPYYTYWEDRNWEYSFSGWVFIFKLVKTSPFFHPKIQYDIFALEIFGILVLTGAALSIAKKRK